MCRLYGFRATEPTAVECTLVHAQNALMIQARSDAVGKSHSSGWGVAMYAGGEIHVERKAWAAYEGEHFSRVAARTRSRTVVGHVRRATVGQPSLENTHPFTHGRWVFAHNGTIVNFGRLKGELVDAMTPGHREAIRGVTDSEHLFHYLLTLREEDPDAPLPDILRRGLLRVVDRMGEGAATDAAGLNVIWTDGSEMVASRWGRTLWYVEREGTHDCEICGKTGVRGHAGSGYRAVVVASEPISHDETWTEVPEGSLLRIGPEARVRREPLFPDGHDARRRAGRRSGGASRVG